MDVTSRFVLDFAGGFRGVSGDPRAAAAILDFGCGAGCLVAEGRAAGLNIQGADVFYGGSQGRAAAESSGLWGVALHEMRDGVLPFPNGCFDLVVNNQVLEHVEDLDRALAEIHRVLKPGGAALSVFPARDAWREGHIGIPFAHWFPQGSRVRFAYALALRSVGLGYWKDQASNRRQWTRDKLAWIDAYTRYRSRE